MSIVGKVLISRERPASASEFWIAVLDVRKVEVGTYVVVEDSELGRILGVVEDLELSSRASSEDSFIQAELKYKHSIHVPHEPTVYNYAKVRVLVREKEAKRPPKGDSLVRLATESDIDLMSKNIPQNKRIVLGFVRGYDSKENKYTWIPIYGHSDYICGPEAAHVNISGMTGLATKTSYAVFLSYTILKQSQDENVPTAIIMFNVKRGDLLRLHKLPPLEKLNDKIKAWCQKTGLTMRECSELIEMWRKALKLGIYPWSYSVKYFTYPSDPYLNNPEYLRGYSKVKTFRYGLGDLRVEELISALYKPNEDRVDTQIALLYTYFDVASSHNIHPTFNDLLEDFRKFKKYFNRNRYEEAVRLGRESRAKVEIEDWHQATAAAIFRRINAFLSRATKIIVRDRHHGEPIDWSDIEPYTIHVIQLYGLDDAEKRLVVNVVLRTVAEGLEKSTGRVERVVIVADELNKYAPRSSSPIKEQLIDIAARGKDIRLSLIGMQQFASNIDPEVYGNCATKVVGKTDVSEILDETYRYLGDFRKIVHMLSKGEILIYHPLYAAPILARFPVPLHILTS